MCGRGRAKAVLPIPAREEQEPQEEEEWTAGGLSNNQRKKLRKQLTIQAEKLGVTLVDSKLADQQAAAATMEGPKSVRYTPTTVEALGEPPKVSIPAFGINTLPTLKEPKKAFVYPPLLKWPKTAVEVVAEHTYCSNASKLADAREREADYTQLLQRLAARTKKDPAHEAATRKLFSDVKAEISTLMGNKGGGGKAAIEGMRSKLATITFDESERVGTAALDRAKMEAKVTEMEKCFTAQIEELQRRQKLFNECKLEMAQAWLSDEAQRVEYFQQSCQAWQMHIKEAEEALVIPVAMAEPIAAEPVEDGLSASAQGAPVDIDQDLMTKEEEQEARQEMDYALVAPWSPKDLPEVVEPKPDEAQFWLHLATHVMDWSENHACAPCTYRQLIAPGDPKVLMGSVVKLIGRKFWDNLYGDRTVLATDVVPRHLGFVLYNALQKPYAAAAESLGKEASEEATEKAMTNNKKAMKEMKLKLDKRAKKGSKTTLGM